MSALLREPNQLTGAERREWIVTGQWDKKKVLIPSKPNNQDLIDLSLSLS